MPTDLLGVKGATYNIERAGKNLTAALGPACFEIRNNIQRLGSLKDLYAPRFYQKVTEAPQLAELLQNAKEDVFVSASSMSYVAQNLREKIFDRARDGIAIKLLVMENNKTNVDLIESYGGISDFHSELRWCHQVFRKWRRDADSESLDLQIRTTSIVPIVLNIIDGKREDGAHVGYSGCVSHRSGR